MEIFLLILSGIVLLVDFSLIVLWIFNFKNQGEGISDQPFVSILIAARNEEENIASCLESILKLDYPSNRYEVLVGDDMSKDQTGEILEAFSARNHQIISFTISKNIVEGNGKANVLAQLAKKAKGEFLFVTDADIAVPSQWVRSMLLGLKDNVALVTGTSVVAANNFLSNMQRIDWLFATAMLKVVSDLNIPVTTMGNNMLVRKSVYEEVGGYEALPFSVTEDLELFNHIKTKHKTVNLFSPDVLNESKPQKNLVELLVQRKRWMRGAFQLPLIMIVLLFIQSSFFVVIVALLFIMPIVGLGVIGIKLLLRSIFLFLAVNKLKIKVNLFTSLIFELYSALFSIASLVYYIFPGQIVWKGRKY